MIKQELIDPLIFSIIFRNQSRRYNIRVNGISESLPETCEEAEKKVVEVVKRKLGMDIDIESAYRIERKSN